jgi:glycosidase
VPVRKSIAHLPARISGVTPPSRLRAWLLFALVIVLTITGIGGAAVAQRLLAPPLGGVAANPLPVNDADFKPDAIYQVIVDRFFDGDPGNDDPPGDTGLSSPDHSNWHAYWGGDLKGLTEKLPYIAGMGMTAIWISPVVDNVHQPLYYNGSPLPNAGYHGYWARDDYQIDPHFGTWTDFDTFVQAAHKLGIKVVMDFAPNHSNPISGGELGDLYQDGTLVASYTNDTVGWFHHNGTIFNFDDPYSDEYQNLYDLADLAQEQPQVDAYLKGAITRFLQHGVDGIRVDAVKHTPGSTGGWLRTLNDVVEAQGPHYMVGEWPSLGLTDPQHNGQLRFANNSGLALLDFSMNNAIQDVFVSGDSMVELDATQQHINQDFLWPNDQPLFIDNHDMPRFLTMQPRHDLLHAALAFTLTAQGIPIIYYGTEQYLFNNTDGGNDPYNRPMMAGFDTTTPAYQLISRLAHLRQTNPALAYGGIRALSMSQDVYIYERQFFGNVVVVAINRNDTQSASFDTLATHLPAGRYTDLLGGQFGGSDLLVDGGGATRRFTLQPSEIAVWQFTAAEPTTPELGSVGPELTHPGDQLILDGEGFGNQQAGSTVQLGTVAAPVLAWTAHSITVQVPAVPGGLYTLRACLRAGPCSNGMQARIDSGPQVPVTFTINNVPTTTPADHVYLTGDVYELGNESVDKNVAIGPLLGPNKPTWFVLASVPTCRTIHFHFFILHADDSRTTESGPEHVFATPCSGADFETVSWQT